MTNTSHVRHNDTRTRIASLRATALRLLEEQFDVALAKRGFHGSVGVEVHFKDSIPNAVKHNRTECGTIRLASDG